MKVSYIFSLFLFLVLTGCSESNTEESIASAKNKIAGAKYNDAIIILKNVLQKDANAVEARYLLGDVYLTLGVVRSSEKELIRALDLGFEGNDIILKVAKSLRMQNKFYELLEFVQSQTSDDTITQSALLMYQTIAYLDDKQSENASKAVSEAQQISADSQYSQLAEAYYLTSRFDTTEALELVNNILEEHSSFIEAWLLKGQINLAINNHEQAVQSFRKVKGAYPEDSYVNLLLASALVKNSNFNEANTIADKLLSVASENPLLHQIKGYVAYNKEDYDSAQKHLRKAIQNGLSTNDNRLLAGLSQYQQQNFEQSYYYLSSLKNVLAASHPAQRLIYALELTLGYNDQANETLDNLDNLSQEDAKFYAVSSYAYLKQGNEEQARKGLQVIQNIGSDNVHDLTNEGLLKLSLNDLGGIEQLQMALELDPNHSTAQLALAAAHIKNENFEEALKVSNEIVTKSDNKVLGLNIAGITYTKMRNFVEAQRSFTEALKIEPNNITTKMNYLDSVYAAGNSSEAFSLLEEILSSRPGYTPALLFLYNNESSFNKSLINTLTKGVESEDRIDNRLLLSLAKFKKNNFDDAISTLTNVTTKDSSTPNKYWEILISSYYQLDDIRGMDNALSDWTATQPNNLDAWLRYIAFKESRQDFIAALQYTKDALKQFPNNIKLKLAYISLLIKNEKHNEAERQLRSLPDAVAISDLAQGLKGRILFKRKKIEDAFELLHKGYSVIPNNDFSTDLFTSYQLLGKRAEGLSFLENHVAAHKEDIPSALLLANIYIMQQPEKAKKIYLDIVAHKNNAIALNNLAWILFNDGQYQQADQYATKGLGIIADSANMLNTAGIIKIALKDKAKAIELLKKAVELAPEDASIRENLAQAEAL